MTEDEFFLDMLELTVKDVDEMVEKGDPRVFDGKSMELRNYSFPGSGELAQDIFEMIRQGTLSKADAIKALLDHAGRLGTLRQAARDGLDYESQKAYLDGLAEVGDAYRSVNNALLDEIARAWEMFPNDPYLSFLAMDAHCSLGQYEQAASLGRRVLDVRQGNEKVMYGMYQVMSRMDNPKVALYYAISGLAANPESYILSAAVSLGIEAAGDKETALTYIDAAIQRYRDPPFHGITKEWLLEKKAKLVKVEVF